MSDTQTEIKDLVTNNKVALFMKGSPESPQCGFSAQVVHILNGYTKEYKSVDVLQDENIRQGVKEYSDWPTVPQLYVNGEFIGGCDIITEMHENGELTKVLSA